MGPKPTPAHVRIMHRVTVNADGCWIYGGWLDGHGYGSVCVGSTVDGSRRQTKTHRVMYEHHKGPIPLGLVPDHYRLNPGPRQAPCSTACVNPDHLELVTQRENVLRGVGPLAQHARKACCPKCGGAYVFVTNHKGGSQPFRRCRPCTRVRMREYMWTYVPVANRKAS